MEFYDEPVGGAYRTDRSSWFEMPLEDGSSTTVIAVSRGESTYWIIAYAILISSIFVAVSRLTTSLVLALFPLQDRGNRHAMLVSYFNSDSPYTVLSQMWGFSVHALFHSWRRSPKLHRAVNWNTLLGALILAVVAGSNISADLVTRFIVVKSIIVRSAARANPDTMFYPRPTTFAQLQIVRSPAGFQALGRVEAARQKLAERITIKAVNGTSQNGSTLEFSYSYSLNGSDMGLQLAPNLVYAVIGHCRTEYKWVNTSDPDFDIYPIWDGIGNMTDTVSVDSDWNNPPFLNVFGRPDEVNRSLIARGYEFALVPNTQSRKSDSPNAEDPWYLTEDNPGYVPRSSFRNGSSSPYQIKRGRPPILCWQNDTWSLGSNKVYNVQDLTELTSKGLRLSKFLRETLFPIEFSAPPMVQLANNLGFSWMDAAKYTRVNTKQISANLCNTTNELERLVYLSYLASREVVRNTVLVYPSQSNRTNTTNLAAVNGAVPYESADFIIESQDVAALSVTKMLTIPSVAGFLWFIVWLRNFISYGKIKNDSEHRHQLQSIAFQSTQLYRFLDEKITGERRWSGRTGIPFIRYIDPDTPTTVSGAARSKHIQPKLVSLPTTECKHRAPGWLMFWKVAKRHDYELVMTTSWEDIDKSIHMEDIEDDIGIDDTTERAEGKYRAPGWLGKLMFWKAAKRDDYELVIKTSGEDVPKSIRMEKIEDDIEADTRTDATTDTHNDRKPHNQATIELVELGSR